MEVNIDNAFMIFIKLSLDPFLNTIETLLQNVEVQCHRLALAILKRPLLSSMLITCFMVMIMGILTLSVIVLTAVFCAAVVIVIFEGFFFGLILILAAVITVSVMGFIIMVICVKMVYQKQNMVTNDA